MKYLSGIKFAIAITVAVCAVSCGSVSSDQSAGTSAPAGPQSYGSGLSASEGESEIVFHSSPNAGTLSVYVDGQLKQTMRPQDSVTVIVPDGQHTFWVDWTAKDSEGRDVSIKGEQLSVNTETKKYVFSVSLPALLGGSSMLLTGRKVTLNKTSESALTGGRTAGASKGIEGAAIRACDALMADIPGGAKIAVLSVSSNDKDMSETVMYEIEYHLLQSRQFTIVNRNQLDAIYSEQNLGLSGDVSDESAASIGNMLGAGIVITGAISGSGTTRALRLRALDTTTGRVVAMSREVF